MLLVLVGLWMGAARYLPVPRWMLPGPSEVGSAFAGHSLEWLRDAGTTLLESVLGFLAGSLIGISAGIAFAHSRWLERLLYPYAITLKTIPLVALAPILAIWFPNGLAATIIMGALITFFPCIVNTVMGLRSPSREMLELMDSLAATRVQTFTKLRLPAAMPSIFSALKISATLAVIGAIVAEMTGAHQGLGYRLIRAQEDSDMVTMVIAVALAALAGILFFGMVSLLEQRLIYWENSNGAGAEGN